MAGKCSFGLSFSLVLILHVLPAYLHAYDPASLALAAQRPNDSENQPQHVAPGRLIHMEKPVYPVAAREARIEGPVILSAMITEDGFAKNLKIINGKFSARRDRSGSSLLLDFGPYV